MVSWMCKEFVYMTSGDGFHFILKLFLFVIAVQTEQKPRDTARKEQLAPTRALPYSASCSSVICAPVFLEGFFLQCKLQKLLKCTGKSKVFGCHILGLS